MPISELWTSGHRCLPECLVYRTRCQGFPQGQLGWRSLAPKKIPKSTTSGGKPKELPISMPTSTLHIRCWHRTFQNLKDRLSGKAACWFILYLFEVNDRNVDTPRPRGVDLEWGTRWLCRSHCDLSWLCFEL